MSSTVNALATSARQRDPTLAVILPAHRSGPELSACLASIAATNPKPDEWIVVVDGGGADVVAAARAAGAHVIALAPACGPAAARNAGARAASGDLLFFLDSDVTVPPDIVGHVRELFGAHPEWDAVIGSYDDAPGAGNFLSQYRNLLHHYVHQSGREEAGTFWGACGAIRRDAFFAAGGFDESYREASIEDIELGYRLRALGRSIRLCKQLQVKHLKRWDVVGMIQTDFLRRALPWTLLLLREGRMDNDLNIDVRGRLSVLLAFAVAGSWAAALWPKTRRVATLTGPAALAALVTLNGGFYKFLARKRGAGFAVSALPWHLLYFLISGAAFGLGICLSKVRTGFRSSG